MHRWGDTTGIDTRMLQQAHDILVRQQRSVGGERQMPAFEPGTVIGQNAVVQFLGKLQQVGQIAAAATIGLDHFLLGYIYRLLEEGQYERLVREFTDADHHGDTTDDQRDSEI